MANNSKKRGGFFFSSPIGKSTSLITSAGGVFLGFILIIITGGLLLTGGFNPLPKNQLSDVPDGVYEIDEESLIEDEKRGNLQLRVIKFKECQSQASATLFVDRSGSMGYGNKLQGLKDALNGFIDQMGDESVTGLITYSTDVTENVPIDFFSANQSQMRSAISSIKANGGTRTRNAFNFALGKILDAKQIFPEKEHVVVFMSDGIPEAGSELEKTCIAPACSPDGRRCFEAPQDPTNTTVGPDIAQQIKDAGIKIYSVALYDARDTCFQDDLRAMMQRVASPNSYFETPNPGDLERIYDEISTQICQSAGL